MKLYNLEILSDFIDRHPNEKVHLDAWLNLLKSYLLNTPHELKKFYPSADPVPPLTVFNFRGGHYRIIATIAYKNQSIYFEWAGTHPEYDRLKLPDDLL